MESSTLFTTSVSKNIWQSGLIILSSCTLPEQMGCFRLTKWPFSHWFAAFCVRLLFSEARASQDPWPQQICRRLVRTRPWWTMASLWGHEVIHYSMAYVSPPHPCLPQAVQLEIWEPCSCFSLPLGNWKWGGVGTEQVCKWTQTKQV